MRLQPGGADFREAMAREIAALEQQHTHAEAALREKLSDSKREYAALEDEFRTALTIEAARFSEVCSFSVLSSLWVEAELQISFSRCTHFDLNLECCRLFCLANRGLELCEHVLILYRLPAKPSLMETFNISLKLNS